MKNADLRVELRPIDRLVPRADNPRTHSVSQIDQITASIREFGWTNPILVGTDDDVIAGHGRLLAARKLGMQEVPVIVLAHLTEAQRRALVIADNQLALNAGWDEELLRIQLGALQNDEFDVNLIGFEDEELARFLAGQDQSAGLTDEDAIPEIPDMPVSAAGDLWILGNHRLLVGNATASSDVNLLMGDELADLVFTNPPYNVDYEGYTDDRLKIRGDRMNDDEFRAFLIATFTNYRRIVKPGASLYVCHSSSWQREFQNALEQAGFRFRGPMPANLGEKHFCLGFWPLQIRS